MASLSYPIDDESQSILFLKRFTSYLLSNILYVREFFDENSYYHESYDGIKLRILSKKSKNENVLKIIEYLQGCFESIEMKFLKSLVMGIFEKTNGVLSKDPIESYQFDYAYKQNNDNSLYDTNLDICKKTSIIFKNLLSDLQSLKKLSRDKEYFLCFKLCFHDNAEFSDYKPRGFVSSNTVNTIFSVNKSFVFKGENINTKFHLIDFQFKSSLQSINQINKRNQDSTKAFSKSTSGLSTNENESFMYNKRIRKMLDSSFD